MTYFFAILMLFSFLVSSSSFYFPCKKLRHPNVNELAIELVQQLEKLKNGSPIERQAIQNNGKILIAFDESNIISIIKDDNIYNAHYLNNLNPDDTYASRKESEDAIINKNINCYTNQEKLLRPKYAYFLPKSSRLHLSDEYGNIFAMVKDHVKKRSTYTLEDSMDLKNKLNAHTFYQKKNLDNSLKSYMEAQIWGLLQLSDIEYLLINCPFSKKITNHMTINKIKKVSSIPLY